MAKKLNKGKPKFPGKLETNQSDNTRVLNTEGRTVANSKLQDEYNKNEIVQYGTNKGKPYGFENQTIRGGMESLVTPDNVMMAMGVGALAKAGVNAVGNKFLPNASKINPFANNLNNPNKFYRTLGKEGYDDALKNKMLTARVGGDAAGRPSDVAYFAKGKVGNYPGNKYVAEVSKQLYKKGDINPITNTVIKSRHGGYKNLNELGNSTNVPLSEAKIYKKDWLQGYKEIPNTYSNGGNVNEEAGNRGMMKARMALDAHFGNPSAQRMVSPNPKTGMTPEGIGTHYMASMDNYAVPLLQDKGGNYLQYNSNPAPSSEDMRFESPEDAKYFAENYKNIAPMMRSNTFASGGRVLPKFGNGGNKPGNWAGTDRSGKAIQTNFANSTAGENVVTGAGIAGAAVPMLTSFIPDDRITDSEGNEVGSKESMGKSILNSAAQGASMGAAAGPWGAAIGAGVGAIYGGVTNSMNNADIDRAQQQANMRIQNRNISNSVLTNKNMFSTNTSNNDQMIAAKGGTVVNEDMGNPNAELELNETFRDPMTGETGIVDGPSHDNGGIEMSLAEGTQIWSDRLKHNGKTFASLTKPIINKIANLEKGLDTNPNSRFKQNSIKLLNSQLDFFFNIQESDKQQDEMKRTLKKQEGGVVDDMGNYHYANGGIYIKPENRNKMAMGGMMKYDEGGPVIGSINPATQQPFTQQEVDLYYQNSNPGAFGNEYIGAGNTSNGVTARRFQPIPEANMGVTPIVSQFNSPSGNNTFASRNYHYLKSEFKDKTPQDYGMDNEGHYAGWKLKEKNNTLGAEIGQINNTPAYQPYNSGATKPGGMINFNRELPKPVLPQVYNSTPYIQKRGNQNPYKGTDITGNKTVDNNGNIVKEPTTNQSGNTPQGYVRNNKGELIQAGALAGSAFTQLNNINRLAAPGIRPDVRLSGAIPNPRYVDLSAERGAINRSAMNAMGEAQRGFGNSAAAQAFKNKARINQLEGAGKSYLNQENINADIYNKFAGMRGDAAMKEAMMNNEIANSNIENKYKFNESRVGNQNAVIGDIGKGVSDIGRNRTNYSNQLEMANIYGNAREGTVQNQMLGDTESARAMFNASTPEQKAAWNAERVKRNLSPFKYGGTVNRKLIDTYANGGTKTNKYRQELYSKAIGPDVQTDINARQMDDEYSKALEGTADTYTSEVTGLDYKVIRSLPKGEKRLLAANMWKDLHGTAPTKAQENATVKAIEGKKVSSPGAKEVVNQSDPTFSMRDNPKTKSDWGENTERSDNLQWRNKFYDSTSNEIRDLGYNPMSKNDFNINKPSWITPEIEDLNTYKQQQESDNIKEQKTIANLKKWNPNAASYYEKTGDLQGALDNYVAPDRFDVSSGSAGYSIGKAAASGDMQGVDYLNAGMLLAGAFGARKGKAPSNSKQLNERNPRLSNVRSTPEERTIQGTKNWKYQTEQTPGLQEYYDKKAKMFKEVNPKVKYTDPIKQQGKLEPSKQKLLPGATKTSIDMEDEQFALDFNKRQNTKNNAKLDRKLKVAEGADKYTKRSLNNMNKRLDNMEVDSYGKIKETENTVKNMQKSEIFKIKDLERKMKLAKNQGDTKKYNKLYDEYLTVMELN